MRKVFIVSDTHFGHDNIITYHRRKYALTDAEQKEIDALPFGDKIKEAKAKKTRLDRMHDDMIKQWNAKVGKDDLVIHLGDVALGMSEEQMKAIFDKLNGIKMLIPGNHEKGLFQDRHSFNRIGFKNVEWDLMDKQMVIGKYILTHEPMSIVPEGFINIHGHVHGGIAAAAHAVNKNKINACWDMHMDGNKVIDVSSIDEFKLLAERFDWIEYVQTPATENTQQKAETKREEIDIFEAIAKTQCPTGECYKQPDHEYCDCR